MAAVRSYAVCAYRPEIVIHRLVGQPIVHATIRYVDGRTVELDEPLNPLGSTMKLVTSAVYYAAAAQRAQYHTRHGAPDDEHARSCPSCNRHRVPPGALGESLAAPAQIAFGRNWHSQLISNDHCTK